MHRFHGLRQNRDLSTEEYGRIKALVAKVNDLVHRWPGYVSSASLDPDIFHTQNEWAEIIKISQAEAMTYSDSYRAINLVRLWSPFTGFHLPFLDRVDGFKRFDDAQTEAVKLAVANGIPENIIELMDTLDPQERLAHVVDEQEKLTANLPGKYVVKAPPRGGEVGLVIGGVITNPDTLITQGRINSFFNAGILELIERRIAENGKCRILEIGAGYGALAHALHAIYPNDLEYVVVELPNVLWNAVCYLGALGPIEICGPGEPFPRQFSTLLIPNYLTEEYRQAISPVDLAINTMSFIEMSEAQVRYYRDLIHDTLAAGGKCFLEGTPSKPHHTDCQALFSETMKGRNVPSGPVYKGAIASKVWERRISILSRLSSRCWGSARTPAP